MIDTLNHIIWGVGICCILTALIQSWMPQMIQHITGNVQSDIPPPCVCQVITADNSDLYTPHLNHKKGRPLESNQSYTYCFGPGMPYDLKLFTRNQIKLFHTLTKNIMLIERSDWNSSDIRIKYDEKQGFSSFLGKDIFLLKEGHWTTSFGKMYNPSYAMYGIWHELIFHCVMGCGHEQQNTRGGGVAWSDFLYEDFKNRFGWDREQVDAWKVAESGDNYMGTDYDSLSNTHYYYDGRYTEDGKGTGNFNYMPSRMDIKYIQLLHGNGLS